MRVLIFSLAYYPVVGGAEVAIKELTDQLSDIEFDLITMRFDSRSAAHEQCGRVNVHRVGRSGSYINKILFIPRAAWLAYRLNKARKYDRFWAMMTNMTFPIALLRLAGNRTPYILTLQDGDPFERVFERKRIRLFRPLLVYGFKHATVVQAISNFLAEWPPKLGYRGRIEVIPNGVDINRFQGTSVAHDGVVLITTSRLFEKNGVADIIDALVDLPASVSLDIAGIGPLDRLLKAQVAKRRLEKRVRFLGHVSQEDVPRLLHASDIFIRPSLSEGQGISFLEAMAAGLSIIGTPVGGIPDFLVDGETGLFCRPHDPASIVAAVERLLNDEVLRKRLIENGKKLVAEKYDWDLIAREMRSRVFSI